VLKHHTKLIWDGKMKKLLIALVAVLLMVTSVYFINKEGTFDVRCFIDENEVEMCFDDSLWHYNYWLERKQDLIGDKN
jgi:hypothetical protein